MGFRQICFLCKGDSIFFSGFMCYVLDCTPRSLERSWEGLLGRTYWSEPHLCLWLFFGKKAMKNVFNSKVRPILNLCEFIKTISWGSGNLTWGTKKSALFFCDVQGTERCWDGVKATSLWLVSSDVEERIQILLAILFTPSANVCWVSVMYPELLLALSNTHTKGF